MDFFEIYINSKTSVVQFHSQTFNISVRYGYVLSIAFLGRSSNFISLIIGVPLISVFGRKYQLRREMFFCPERQHEQFTHSLETRFYQIMWFMILCLSRGHWLFHCIWISVFTMICHYLTIWLRICNNRCINIFICYTK